MDAIRVFEDSNKIWVVGIPKNFAEEMIPDVEWSTVYIKVVDPPRELSDKLISSKMRYIFSEYPVKGGIESSWCRKPEDDSEEEVQYIELSEEEFGKFEKGGSEALKKLIKDKLEGGNNVG